METSPPITVLDSRRITGTTLVLKQPGAVLDVRLDQADRSRAIAAWCHAARSLLDAVGWSGSELCVRPFQGGVSLGITAPIDVLYAATELNESAWDAAAAQLRGEPGPDLAQAAAAIRSRIADEANPRLLELRDRARGRHLTFLSDEDGVSVGSGRGALVWPPTALPDPAEVKWSRAYDVPIVLVTGSNGKTTVVRLLGAMISAGEATPGMTSTEGVLVGSRLIGEGDFSGPSGARLALRHAEVDVAILETARGGILRRGLAVDRADVAVVTNVAEDHLGEFGVQSLSALAETKLLVATTLGAGGTLVLNADDRLLVERGRSLSATITWFSLDRDSSLVRQHVAAGGSAVLADGGEIVVARAGERMTLMPLSDVPITFGGVARHNVANTLAAVGAGLGLGLSSSRMVAALRQFGRNARDNPGRANLIELGGLKILLDYAHNPHGMAALVEVAQAIPAARRLVMFGQAGDRDDHAIRDLARAAWALRPDHVVVKEMDQYLRGRAPGEVPDLLTDELARLGAPASAVSRVGPDLEGVRTALAWARPGDLLVMAVHQDRGAILELFDQLAEMGWRAGTPLPPRV
jgi:cyanophycin synthetase